jgi:hypothetical protein
MRRTAEAKASKTVPTNASTEGSDAADPARCARRALPIFMAPKTGPPKPADAIAITMANKTIFANRFLLKISHSSLFMLRGGGCTPLAYIAGLGAKVKAVNSSR